MKGGRDLRFSTIAIHAGQEPDPATGAIATPIYQTSTFVKEAPDRHKGYEYSRTGNPTRHAMEANLAALEGGRSGFGFSSGVAAISAVLQALDPGDHVLCSRDLYGGSYRLFTKFFARWGLNISFVDAGDLHALDAAATKKTKLLWLETPSNPTLRILDLRALSDWAHARKILVAVDNTFATPALQRPLGLGVDVVVHSTTKYLGGHSDVLGGAVVTDDAELAAKISSIQKTLGAVPGPMDCFLVLRGTKTLALRMERHSSNALAVAKHLLAHAETLTVHYPGLPSHPGYDLAKAQMSGFGGVVAVELKGSAQRATRFVTRTKLFALADSLGGVESLIGHPATMSHASIPREERLRAGITDGLIRLSVGIEDIQDLLADLDQAILASLN